MGAGPSGSANMAGTSGYGTYCHHQRHSCQHMKAAWGRARELSTHNCSRALHPGFGNSRPHTRCDFLGAASWMLPLSYWRCLLRQCHPSHTVILGLHPHVMCIASHALHMPPHHAAAVASLSFSSISITALTSSEMALPSKAPPRRSLRLCWKPSLRTSCLPAVLNTAM